MKKVLRDSTIKLVKKYKDQIGLCKPVSEEDAKEVSLYLLQFFTDLEASMSLDLDEGMEIDRKLLEDISNAVDDFNLENDEYIDFKEINEIISG
ncbi:hypothetical protein AR505_0399 [methanogenic archaeon ISO4-H5]|nr:hypothetical protein AR505_0399 [methanogenic archaeon ISO4-H5]